MKKKLLALLVALTLICSMFATVSVSAATSDNVDLSDAGGTTGFTTHGYDASTVGIMFGYGGVLSLGNLDLSGYDTIKVTYATDPSYFSAKSGAMEMNACFAVYSVNRSVGWPAAGGEHNAEGLLAKADTTAGPGTKVAWSACERTVNIDVSDVDYSGNVYLSHYNPTGHEALVVGIKLIAKTGGVDIPDAPVPPISAITTSIDFSSTDGSQTLTGGGCGGSTTYTFPGTFDITESVGFGGWAATPNGVAKYQYSIDGENFYDIADASITERPDLAGVNISYPEGHSTAGFVVTVPVTAFNNGTNTLTIRLIDTQDGYFDIIKATVIINDDNNNDNINSDNSENVGTDDSVAVVFVMMVAIVAMAAVVIKRRKENI